jgi:hypothetical protein
MDFNDTASIRPSVVCVGSILNMASVIQALKVIVCWAASSNPAQERGDRPPAHRGPWSWPPAWSSSSSSPFTRPRHLRVILPPIYDQFGMIHGAPAWVTSPASNIW